MAKARGALLLAAKLCVAALAFAFILSRQSFGELSAAVRQISLAALLSAALVHASGLVVGTVRWRALMRAYGAPPQASFAAMLRTYSIGDFYNTYVPGGVGGDILRGVITRRSFVSGGATGALAVVLIERCLGLGAVLALTALTATLRSDTRLGALVLPYCLLGIAVVASVVLAITHSQRVTALAPSRLRARIPVLPTLHATRPFLFACLLSFLTQSIAVFCGHLLIASIDRTVTLSDSFLALPMATAAGFFPLAVAGIGPRDVALVGLYELLGIPRAHGTATALAYSGVVLFVAAFGGLVQLFAPLRIPSAAEVQANSQRP